MSMLRVTLFGGVGIAHGDQAPETNATPSVRALLAYLLLFRHRYHHREALIGLFWGDYRQDRARGCLNTALWRLRQVLEPAGVPKGTYIVTTTAGEVGFSRTSRFWLDTAEFEDKTAGWLKSSMTSAGPEGVADLEAALSLYTGDLLEGFYDDWVLRERERLRCLYLRGLAYLMRCYGERAMHEEAAACGLQILRLDPLRESVHRELMRSYLKTGRRALAVRQYEMCRDILAAELGIPPMEETQALFAEALSSGRAGARPAAEQDASSLIEVLADLRGALRVMDQARDQLRRAAQIIESRAGDAGYVSR
jgi:DNA-binding SARP family transcriptional activator